MSARTASHRGPIRRALCTADPMPIDNNLPMTVVRGDRIYLLGGETGGGVVEGEFYGHHPDLLLIGKLEAIQQ